MACELSPMAAESYVYNFFNEDLQEQAKTKNPNFQKTVWLSSQYAKRDLNLRLRENPRNYPHIGQGFSDIAKNGLNMKGALVVANIVALNSWLKEKPKIARALADGFGAGGVDLVSGGPPCQSFSMAGLRRVGCEKNALPWEFAKLTQLVQPKMVLLENVTGILRPFSDNLGNKYHAWFELAKAFSSIGYVPLCLHVNAKLVGVPQNRPRFVILGVRHDIYNLLAKTFNDAEERLFRQPFIFFKRIRAKENVPFGELDYLDVERKVDLEQFQRTFLAPLVAYGKRYVTVREAIDDLRVGGGRSARFPKDLARTFDKVLPSRGLKNHALRKNSPLVQRRFRLYQILQKIGNGTHGRVLGFLNGKTNDISDSDWAELSKFDYFLESGNYVRFQKKVEFISYLMRHPTKKYSQKALLPDEPASAALSIPDDMCHYHHDELRTLSVREMARIQSFPDNFEFRSKVTTGGQMRIFEVPQYTQVGNAVPPCLARALGQAISALLKRTQEKLTTRPTVNPAKYPRNRLL